MICSVRARPSAQPPASCSSEYLWFAAIVMDAVGNSEVVKAFSVLSYVLMAICSIVFMSSYSMFFNVMAGLYMMGAAVALTMIHLQAPNNAVLALREGAPFLFMPIGRSALSLALAALLFGMGTFGIIVAIFMVITVGLNL